MVDSFRYGTYPKPMREAHPRDCSIMTYRGHQVFRTLIRCHFSPIETTGAKYIYTGSSDGRIHVRRSGFFESIFLTEDVWQFYSDIFFGRTCRANSGPRKYFAHIF